MAVDWWYDDIRQVGLDFSDEAQVATYDARQGITAEQDRKLLLELGVGPDAVLADIGCGTGILVCEAARLCRTAIGIDVSSAMLAAARRRARDLGCENLTFENAGFLSFSQPDSSLDWVTTKHALHHLPDFWKAMALLRIFNALKPGGRLYIRDVMFGDPPHRLAEVAEDWIQWLVEETGYSREEGAGHIREEHSTFSWAIGRMLTDCGYRILEHTQTGVYGVFLAEKPPGR